MTTPTVTARLFGGALSIAATVTLPVWQEPTVWEHPGGWQNPLQFSTVPRWVRNRLGFIEVETYPDNHHILIRIDMIARMDPQGYNGQRTMIYWGAGNATSINETMVGFLERIAASLDHYIRGNADATLPAPTAAAEILIYRVLGVMASVTIPIPTVTAELVTWHDISANFRILSEYTDDLGNQVPIFTVTVMIYRTAQIIANATIMIIVELLEDGSVVERALTVYARVTTKADIWASASVSSPTVTVRLINPVDILVSATVSSPITSTATLSVTK